MGVNACIPPSFYTTFIYADASAEVLMSHFQTKKLKMVAENICQFNKFGFCKFKTNCFRKHEERKCENEQCEIRECPLRHPKKCRYFVEFNNCKFGTFCKFGHDAIEKRKVDKDIETLQKQLVEVKHDICEKENYMTNTNISKRMKMS